jgi:hypothetical protein
MTTPPRDTIMAPSRILLFLFVTSFVAPATCAELYRCVADGGAVSFQDVPCPGSSQLSRTIPILVDPGRSDADGGLRSQSPSGTGTPAKATQAKGKPGPAARPGRSRSASKSNGTRSKHRAACSMARKDRDVALDRLGLNRTFEKLRALEDQVQEACKGL